MGEAITELAYWKAMRPPLPFLVLRPRSWNLGSGLGTRRPVFVLPSRDLSKLSLTTLVVIITVPQITYHLEVLSCVSGICKTMISLCMLINQKLLSTIGQYVAVARGVCWLSEINLTPAKPGFTLTVTCTLFVAFFLPSQVLLSDGQILHSDHVLSSLPSYGKFALSAKIYYKRQVYVNLFYVQCQCFDLHFVLFFSLLFSISNSAISCLILQTWCCSEPCMLTAVDHVCFRLWFI